MNARASWTGSENPAGFAAFPSSRPENGLGYSFRLYFSPYFLLPEGSLFLLSVFLSSWASKPGLCPPARTGALPPSFPDAAGNLPAGIPFWERFLIRCLLFLFHRKETEFDLRSSSGTSFSFFTPHTTAALFAAIKKKLTMGLPWQTIIAKMSFAWRLFPTRKHGRSP